MAATTYESPLIAAPNAAVKRTTAYFKFIELLAHIADLGAQYGIEFVRADFGETTANRFTITLSGPIPPAQLATGRYPLTQTSP